jgi:hypothetical protein
MNVSDTLGYRSELRSYYSPNAERLQRIVMDAVACGVLIAVMYAFGYGVDWAKPYIGAVLISWVLSDFASNLLGLGSMSAIGHVREGGSLLRVLVIENAVLASICVPIGVLVTWVYQWIHGQWGLGMVFSIVACIGICLPWFAVGDVVSALAVRQSSDVRKIMRNHRIHRAEINVAIAYFATMFVFGPLVAAPAVLFFKDAISHGTHGWVTPTLAALAYAVVVWIIGLVVGARLASTRRERIVEVLAN